jgi:GDP-D-mannose dehydratase
MSSFGSSKKVAFIAGVTGQYGSYLAGIFT